MTEIGRPSSRRPYPARPDYWLLVVVAALLVMGIAEGYSAALAMSSQSPLRMWARHLAWVAVGLLAMVAMARFDYHRFQDLAAPLMFLGILALVAVLVRGHVSFGARRWLLEGSVQPSEAVKLVLVIYVAYWLATKGPEIRHVTYGLIPYSLIVGLVASLVLVQPDFSTAMLIVGVAIVMFFAAGASVRGLLAASLLAATTGAILVLGSSYRLERVLSFRTALQDPLAAGYQVRQAVVALGSGRLTGRGLGQGILKFGWLPAAHNDSIFALVGEELGFVGCALTLALFVLLGWRGLKIALAAEDAFGSYLALGTTLLLLGQALVNMGVVTATLPFTGMTLPFVSYGGSSMVSSLAGVGILFNISGHRLEA